jgi:ferredoxin
MARAIVDPELCQGHTLCNFAAPDVFHLRDEDGHAYVAVEGDLSPEQLERARQAELGCPERAISIEE